jgi:ATP-dependent Clp protease adapter protein ClpS
MADQNQEKDATRGGTDSAPGAGSSSSSSSSSQGSSSTATKPKRARKTTPKKKPPQPLPPWKVLLHNDDKNDFGYVIGTITQLTTLNEQDAELRAVEAHKTGVALLLATHKERAELYQEQFTSKGLVVTIEPAE